ncbi:MAG: HprK-related kinase A [Gammaproteobacteria bacterium]|nr:MAG: HprK-related kinase A [Gammaproteobacteria bacterium]
MKVSDIAFTDLETELASGLCVQTGPFWYKLQSRLPNIARHLATLYPDNEIDCEREFIDFPIAVARKRGLRSFIKPLSEFWFNGHVPFTPLSLDQAPALAEWGMNWCIAAYAHHCLIIHAAVVEKNGHAIIMPAPSGSGKSTLCAALVSRGWRLLSDEHAMIATNGEPRLIPNPRPLSLKNASIDVMQNFWPDAITGEICHDTQKGNVLHVRPPRESVHRAKESATCTHVVFPRYQPQSPLVCEAKDKAVACLHLIENAFNYHILGSSGFVTLTSLMRGASAYDLRYSDLDDAITHFDSWIG